MEHDVIIQEIVLALDEIRPMIQGHGGNITFVRFEDGVVYVTLHGACTNCAISSMTLTQGVEEHLKKKCRMVRSVEAVR